MKNAFKTQEISTSVKTISTDGIHRVRRFFHLCSIDVNTSARQWLHYQFILLCGHSLSTNNNFMSLLNFLGMNFLKSKVVPPYTKYCILLTYFDL